MNDEIKKLDDTIEEINEQISDIQIKSSKLYDFYGTNFDKIVEEKNKLNNELVTLNKLKESPYFARIDFKTENNFDICYIGKKGIVDYENNVVTIDWRAPIASLYYDSNIGNCSYVSPDGIVEGNLNLKRQYDIKNGELLSFNDVDTVSNDELLKPYLGVSAEARLKNIVSTIQKEQNSIIRKPLSDNIIVQGVAGSGKTTVALHRIAYLVYSNRELFKPSDYAIIAPNKFFIKYISSVLPDLDVNGVGEYTIDELLKKYLNKDFIINNYLDRITDNNVLSRKKTSMDMKLIIDNYFSNFQIIPKDDFMYNDVTVINKNVINKVFQEINCETYKSINDKLERLLFLIKKYYDDNKNQIHENLINNNINNKDLIYLKNNISSLLRKYIYSIDKDPVKIYNSILKENNLDNLIINNVIDFEDVSSLLYINYKIIGDENYKHFKHIVIDEAQDYGEFCFYVLKQIFSNASFSIYGDLAQSLYSYRSLDKWDDIAPFYNNITIMNLNKSYRTTIEIMNEANKINRKLCLTEAVPVIRHGKPVDYSCDDIESIINKLKLTYNNIAIITKNQFNASEMYNKLRNKYEINIISDENINLTMGITIIPSYLSKGLEFDAVIIDEFNNYNLNSISDLKLLYVSMTRALHELYIIN